MDPFHRSERFAIFFSIAYFRKENKTTDSKLCCPAKYHICPCQTPNNRQRVFVVVAWTQVVLSYYHRMYTRFIETLHWLFVSLILNSSYRDTGCKDHWHMTPVCSLLCFPICASIRNSRKTKQKKQERTIENINFSNSSCFHQRAPLNRNAFSSRSRCNYCCPLSINDLPRMPPPKMISLSMCLCVLGCHKDTYFTKKIQQTKNYETISHKCVWECVIFAFIHCVVAVRQ